MTRAGTVAEQPPMPSKANIGRLRDAGAQKEAAVGKDATAPSDEVEKEFVELLSKLSGADGEPLDRSTLPEGAAKRTNLRQMHQREIAARFVQDEGGGDTGDGAADDCSACEDLHSAKDPDSADTPKVNAVPPNPPQQVAVIITPPVNPSSSGGEPEVPAREPEANRAPGPTIPSKASLDARLESAETKPVPKQGAAAKAQPEQDVEVRTPTTPTLPTDPKLALGGAPEGAIAKGQVRQDAEDRPRVDAKESVLASASEAAPEGHELPATADVPKAKVLRRETHFAPVTPRAASSRSTSPSAESSQVGATANANGNEPGAPPSPHSPSIVAASPSAAGTVSMATPAAQQIADRIAAEAPAFEAADRAGARFDDSSARPVLKIVQIQLQPAELGTVTVRIELKAADLKLHVETDRPETADIIRGDQDTLSKLLRSAGYGVDAHSIRVVEGDRTVASAQAGAQTGQQGAQTSLQSSTQSHPGGSERQQSAQRDHRGSQGGNTQAPTDRNEAHGTTTNRTGRDLYI